MVSVCRFQQPPPLMPAWSSCSEGSNSRSELPITRAFSQCVLDDVSQHLANHVEAGMLLGRPPLTRHRAAVEKKQRNGLPPLDLSTQPSQEFPSTQDFATPVDQQFLSLYDAANISNAMDDDCSRSPAPSPLRQKRHRPVLDRVCLLDADSDCMSQEGISQSRSLGEPSSCSKATAAGPRSRPPIPRGKRRHEPTRVERSPRPKLGEDGEPAPSGPSLAQQATPVQTSRLYQDYAVDKEIGRGNFSIVYRAVHRQCGKAYAIKRSRRPLHSIADLQSWLDEVKVLAAVEGHPNITTYHDSWSEPTLVGEYQHIKLELCGESLWGHVKAKQALPNQELWDITQQMASALKHIHDLGYAHLDLKPENIFRATNSSNTYKLGDFGLATQRDGSRGGAEGDARYLAPEVLKNQLDRLDKADMFALGATLYELATGIPLPAAGDKWRALREGKLMMLPAVAQQLQNLIKKLMSPEPAARPDAGTVLAMCQRHVRARTQAPSPSRASL